VRVAKLVNATTNLRAALESRTSIDMTLGAIMAQNRCNQEDAMGLLRRASSNRNRKIRDLAAGILTSLGQQRPVTTHFDDWRRHPHLQWLTSTPDPDG
jgi:AmiR/NasT family two-component response regulator